MRHHLPSISSREDRDLALTFEILLGLHRSLECKRSATVPIHDLSMLTRSCLLAKTVHLSHQATPGGFAQGGRSWCATDGEDTVSKGRWEPGHLVDLADIRDGFVLFLLAQAQIGGMCVSSRKLETGRSLIRIRYPKKKWMMRYALAMFDSCAAQYLIITRLERRVRTKLLSLFSIR